MHPTLEELIRESQSIDCHSFVLRTSGCFTWKEYPIKKDEEAENQANKERIERKIREFIERQKNNNGLSD